MQDYFHANFAFLVLFFVFVFFFFLLQTYIGNVVISVNPYKNLKVYSNETIEQYRGVNLYELPPHM